MDIKDRGKVIDFIRELLAKKDDTGGLDNADSLFMSGRLDSLSKVELVVFLEQEFGVDFADVDFEQIDSIDSIEGLVSGST